MSNVLSIIYSLVRHIHLQESARKRCLEVWLSALYGNQWVSSIRLGENLMKYVALSFYDAITRENMLTAAGLFAK